MFWDWSQSWHFFSSQQTLFLLEIVFQWYWIGIKIHESIHINLKSAVIMKPLQLCIFIHNFLSLYLCYLITFWCFACKNLQHIFPPIYDNNYFSFSIHFLIQILSPFNRLIYSSLYHGFVSKAYFGLIYNKG